MDGACPSEDVGHSEDVAQILPRPTPYPPNSTPSPSTPPFPFSTSLIVKTSTGSLILQDYRKIHHQEQALGSFAAVFRRSLQNQARTSAFHQAQPPNLQSSPSPPPPLPTITVSQAPRQLHTHSQHSQDQTSHRKKNTAVIQRHRRLIAISDSGFQNQPLLRPLTAPRSATKAVSHHSTEIPGQDIFHSVVLHFLFSTVSISDVPPPPQSLSALPASAPNASQFQHQHFSIAEVVTPPVTPPALDVLHDRGASSQTSNPHSPLQFSRIHTHALEQQHQTDSFSTNSESFKMSATMTAFKRPRSKSEKHPESPCSSAPVRSTAPITPSQTLNSIGEAHPGTPVPVPEFPASWGPFIEAGEWNPRSPLRNTSVFSSSNIPSGPPQIDQAEIGVKFPSLSNGPGIERRVFIDPHFRRPNPSPKTAYNEGQPSHRPSVSFDDYNRSEQVAHLRTEPPRFPGTAMYSSDEIREYPVFSEDAQAPGTPQFVFPSPPRDEGSSQYEGNTTENALQPYSGEEDQETNDAQEVDDASLRGDSNGDVAARVSENIEIDPRLSNFAWSPRTSIDLPLISVEDSPQEAAGHQSGVPHFTSEPPTAPPTAPLPRLPFSDEIRQVYGHHTISPTTGTSPASYDNTRNLLALSPSPRGYTNLDSNTMDRLPIPHRSSEMSTSSAESILERLLSDPDPTKELLTSPQQTRPGAMRSSSERSFAQVSVVGSDGSVHSRQLSAQETSVFEREVFARLRDSGILGKTEEQLVPHGRLSLEYLTDDREAVDPGPGTSQSSSILSAARPGGPGIMRSGTPPLLFGSRAIGREESSMTRQSSMGVNNNGRLAMAARAVSLRSASRLGQALVGEEDEQDWETVADSRGISRRGLHDIEASAGTGSSIADYSDSSKTSALKSVPRGCVLVHPPHPRYQRSWSMLQDAQSGSLVLTPEYPGKSTFPNQNSTYHHPAPLSEGHDNPFGTPPPPMRHPSGAESSIDVGTPPIPLKSPARKAALSNLKEYVTTGPSPMREDNEWVSTADGMTSTYDEETPTSRGSVSVGNDKVVSGLARKDSLVNEFGSQALRVQSHLSPEDRQYLVDNPLLHRLPTPPFAESKRSSVPSYLLKSTKSANMVQVGTTSASVAQENQGNVRMRSPHRRVQEDDISSGIPTPFSLHIPESLTEIPPRQQKKRARQANHGAKAKVSDGESSPETTAPALTFEQPRVVAEGTTSFSTIPAERRQAQDQHELRANNQPHPELGNTNQGTRTANPGTQAANLSRQTGNRGPQAANRGPWVGPYDDIINMLRDPPNHFRRPQNAIPAIRPVARAGSPHLHRLPLPTGEAAEKREKELSRVFFALCCLFFPVLLIYGHGCMDSVMRHLSHGCSDGFRTEEKKVALWLGYGLFACVPIALVVAASLW